MKSIPDTNPNLKACTPPQGKDFTMLNWKNYRVIEAVMNISNYLGTFDTFCTEGEMPLLRFLSQRLINTFHKYKDGSYKVI